MALKQPPCTWFDWLNDALYSFGFLSTKSNSSLFTSHTQAFSYILVYVDDILITRSDTKVIASLNLFKQVYFERLRDSQLFLGNPSLAYK